MAKAGRKASQKSAAVAKKTTRIKKAATTAPSTRVIAGEDSILVVQFSEPDPLPPGDIETFVSTILATAIASTRARPKGNGAWLFYLATERHHPAGHHCWIGIGPGVPPRIVDVIQAGLEAHRCQTSREHAVIAHYGLRPLLALTSASVEVPIGASSPDDATLIHLSAQITRRPFVIELNQVLKNDLLGAILLGNQPAFRLRYFQDDSLATFSFGRVDLQMFARQPDGSFTAMSRFSDTPPCVLSFDFLEPQLIQLLELLPSEVSERLVENLASGRPFRVPPGTIVVGALARPAPPEPSEATPYVVEAFRSSSAPELSAQF